MARKYFTYVLVPRTELVLYRVEGRHPSRRRLIREVRDGLVEKHRVRFNPPRMAWNKAKVKEASLEA